MKINWKVNWKINWLVRTKNKSFWKAFVPAVLLLIQNIASVFGFDIDLGDIGNKLLAVIEVVFLLLVTCGVVVDPTTPGASDSERAMTYVEPGKAEEEEV